MLIPNCFKYSESSEASEKPAETKEPAAPRETVIDDVPATKPKNVNEFVSEPIEDEENDRYRNTEMGVKPCNHYLYNVYGYQYIQLIIKKNMFASTNPEI